MLIKLLIPYKQRKTHFVLPHTGTLTAAKLRSVFLHVERFCNILCQTNYLSPAVETQAYMASFVFWSL